MYQPSLFSDFIYKSRYARWLDNKNCREDWPETITRYLDFVTQYVEKNHNYKINDDLYKELYNAIFNHEVMPSMRALMTAGKAAAKNHIAMYNCSYLPIDDMRSYDETMCISMSGTGVGFSVESEYVKELPEMPEQFYNSDTTIVFEDSRIGWAKGYREFISILLCGQIPKYDTHKLRLAGARLKTMGGRSSGPQPLIDLLEFTIKVFKKAAGRKLTTIEAHDLQCKIGDIVVVGGVRRSAFISLSDLLDQLMRFAKSGNWCENYPYRRLANNSAVYEDRPEIGIFMKEWLALYNSKSGERGIVNRTALRNVIENANEFRKDLSIDDIRYRDPDHKFGLNPCGEIILRPYSFCNLTEVIVYEDDTPETLKYKVRIATILGTIQSCFTNFKYINKKWQKNCEDERLLGVSLTGIYDNKYTNGKNFTIDNDTQDYKERSFGLFLESLKTEAIHTNLEFSKLLNINSSVAITCVKPSGTSSALNGTSSGIHKAYAPYYIRYVRNDIKDPLTEFMINAGFPYEKDAYDPNHVVCFKFPIKSADDAICNINAIEHLELWLIYQKYWCEHKPSVTISVKEDEWLKVGAWVYEHFDWISGVAFLPAEEDNMIYTQAPFCECSKEEYEKLLTEMPNYVDWQKLSEYELEDQTTSAKELACTAGGCEII